MEHSRPDPGHRRIATLDVETTHFEPAEGELVSIGVGVHERTTPGAAASYETFHRDGRGEAALIDRAMERLAVAAADALVTYNGREFDLPFVAERRGRVDGEPTAPVPDLASHPDRHVDLFDPRRRLADETGERWPSLEASLASCGYPEPVTTWRGEPLTNTRFAEALAPAYLDAVADGDGDAVERLQAVIDHYLRTDLEANVAIYWADVGVAYEPGLLGTHREF